MHKFVTNQYKATYSNLETERVNAISMKDAIEAFTSHRHYDPDTITCEQRGTLVAVGASPLTWFRTTPILLDEEGDFIPIRKDIPDTKLAYRICKTFPKSIEKVDRHDTVYIVARDGHKFRFMYWEDPRGNKYEEKVLRVEIPDDPRITSEEWKAIYTRDETPPLEISHLSVVTLSEAFNLAWQNPVDEDLKGVHIAVWGDHIEFDEYEPYLPFKNYYKHKHTPDHDNDGFCDFCGTKLDDGTQATNAGQATGAQQPPVAQAPDTAPTLKVLPESIQEHWLEDDPNDEDGIPTHYNILGLEEDKEYTVLIQTYDDKRNISEGVVYRGTTINGAIDPTHNHAEVENVVFTEYDDGFNIKWNYTTIKSKGVKITLWKTGESTAIKEWFWDGITETNIPDNKGITLNQDTDYDFVIQTRNYNDVLSAGLRYTKKTTTAGTSVFDQVI